ncbi:hypothetical protein ACFQ4M_04990 [Thauera mechernichensis]|uniref:Glycosyl hydrolase n=1 Tax=Thauera mechernichensis TaxID=82788 RepID=A0ABW3WCD7_9RHOO|nr:hypothetical protein [Thauera mechernichensis]MDG3065917.1 hypothetical protein [Thauera mechernichensis]
MYAFLLIAGFSLLAAWVLFFFANRDLLLRLWREPTLLRPVLIVESDDWGPGPEADAQALQRIAAILARVRDREHRPAVMTLGVVLGKPDGAAILADNCGHYHRRGLGEARYAPIVGAMRQGCEMGVFALQRHGLEHCWPESLLVRARQDGVLRAWLADPEARSEALPSALQSRWVDAGTLPSRPLPEAEVRRAVMDEAEVFLTLFGICPPVAVPNTFVWDDAVERAWAQSGVRCVVTCGRQYQARGADGALAASARRIVNGESGQSGVRYLVRDAYFEPIRGHRAEQVWEAVARRTALGRPTLLETHRESFIDADHGDTALAELERALAGVVERHPDVCFISTERLADAYADRQHALWQRSMRARSVTFLRRLLAEAGLSRPLKLCGLYFVLPMVVRLLATVTPSAAGRH